MRAGPGSRGGPRGSGSRGPGGSRGGPRGREDGPPGRGGDERSPRGGRFFRKKFCRFCGEKVTLIDYKDVERLGKFLTEKGKIIARRITGNCSKHQRGVSGAIKRARHMALLPFQTE